MSWLELDDGILDHPKFIRAAKLGGSEAIHLWLGLRAYCGKHLTDGAIPKDMLDEVRGPANPKKRAAALAALVTVGLLHEADDQMLMHDYLDWSSSRDEVLKAREAARLRKAKSRGGHGGGHGGTDDEPPQPVTVGVTIPSPLHSPSSPDHTHTSELAEPTPEHQALGAELGLDVAYEFKRFKAQAKGKGRQMVDQDACFELWLRDEAKKPKRSEPRASPRGGPPPASDEELRRARNLALENAEAGLYGAKARDAAKTLRGAELTALADRLAKTPRPAMRLAADG